MQVISAPFEYEGIASIIDNTFMFKLKEYCRALEY